MISCHNVDPLMENYQLRCPVEILTLTTKPTTIKCSEIAVGNSALLGFITMLYNYDYISLFVPFFNIPKSLGSLFQRIAPVYDRL